MKKILLILIILILSLNVFGNWIPPQFPDFPLIDINSIDSCQTITESGIYMLENDLTSNGDCIIIEANNVFLSCNDYSITGENSDTAISTIGETNKITIRNCIISNYDIGIELNNSNDSNVLNNTITGNIVNPGISVRESEKAFISENKITKGFIALNSSNEAKIINNEVSGAGAGITLIFSNFGLINNNLIYETNTGISLFSCNETKIKENEITSSNKAIFAISNQENESNEARNNKLNAPIKFAVKAGGKINVFETEINETEIESKDNTGKINVNFLTSFLISDGFGNNIENAEITLFGARDGKKWTIKTNSEGRAEKKLLGFDSLGTNNPIKITINAEGFKETIIDGNITGKRAYFTGLIRKKEENISLNFPLNDSWTNLKEVNFSFTPNDSSTITECKYLNNENNWSEKKIFTGIASNTAKEFNYVFSNDGTYSWKIQCKNEYNHEYESQEHTINIDSIPPIIDFTTLTQANDSEVTKPEILIEVEVIEENLNKVELELNGEIKGILSHSTGNKYNKTINLIPGINQFKVKAIDKAGNTAFTSIRKVTLIESTETSEEKTETKKETSEEIIEKDNTLLLILGILIVLIIIAGSAFYLIKIKPTQKIELEKKENENK